MARSKLDDWIFGAIMIVLLPLTLLYIVPLLFSKLLRIFYYWINKNP